MKKMSLLRVFLGSVLLPLSVFSNSIIYAGNTFSKTKEPAVHTKLEPVYLANVLIALQSDKKLDPVETGKKFAMVSKNAKTASEMVRIIDISNYIELGKTLDASEIEKILKVYPSIETLKIKTDQLPFLYSESFKKYLKDNNIKLNFQFADRLGLDMKSFIRGYYDYYEGEISFKFNEIASLDDINLKTELRNNRELVNICRSINNETATCSKSNAVYFYTNDDKPFLNNIAQLFPNLKMIKINPKDKYSELQVKGDGRFCLLVISFYSMP